MLKKYLPRIFILTGIILIVVSVYFKTSSVYYENKIAQSYEAYISNMSNEEKNVENKNKNEKNNLISDSCLQTESEAPLEETKNKEENPVEKYLEGREISGIIEIPKLGVKAAILEGTDDRALKYTVGHHPETKNPGEKGNCVLLGHRNYVYGHYFRKINELEAGDEVIIKKNLALFTYIITESFVVSPEEVWVLEDTEEAMLTMITCTPMLTYTDRLIVRGLLSE